MIYGVLENLSSIIPDPLARGYPRALPVSVAPRCVEFVHFPPPGADLDTLNRVPSPAHLRLIFEEFFFYQLSIALRRQQHRRTKTGIAFRVRETASATQ